jgi:hypothetical protein
MTEGGTARKFSPFKLTEKLGAGCRCRQASQNNPYRPNMGIILGTDVSGVENEHAVRGGAERKGNGKI